MAQPKKDRHIGYYVVGSCRLKVCVEIGPPFTNIKDAIKARKEIVAKGGNPKRIKIYHLTAKEVFV